MVFPLLAQYTHFEKYYLFCVQRHEEVVTTQIYQSAGTQYSIRTVSRGGTASMALSNVKKPHLRTPLKCHVFNLLIEQVMVLLSVML